MKKEISTDLAYKLSLIIGPLSAPLVLHAAELADFPKLQAAHLFIILGYVIGAIALSQILLRKLLRTFGGPRASTQASAQTPLESTPSPTP